jgi:hypothetical protein
MGIKEVSERKFNKEQQILEERRNEEKEKLLKRSKIPHIQNIRRSCYEISGESLNDRISRCLCKMLC